MSMQPSFPSPSYHIVLIPYSRRRARRWAVAFERGRLQCLTLCTAIHTTLPPELRDLVYEQLFAPIVDHHVIEARDEEGKVRLSNNPLVSMSFFDPRSRIPEEPSQRRDVWKYAEYTGAIVAKEISEHWYRTSTFSIYTEDDLFQKFLTTDVWERGIVPANIVRHLRVIVPSTLDYRNRSEVMDTLDALPGVMNTQAEIVLVLLTYCTVSNAWQLRDMFRLVGCAVKRLRGLGYGFEAFGHRWAWYRLPYANIVDLAQPVCFVFVSVISISLQ
jgi:hypothetical protein